MLEYFTPLEPERQDRTAFRAEADRAAATRTEQIFTVDPSTEDPAETGTAAEAAADRGTVPSAR